MKMKLVSLKMSFNCKAMQQFVNGTILHVWLTYPSCRLSNEQAQISSLAEKKLQGMPSISWPGYYVLKPPSSVYCVERRDYGGNLCVAHTSTEVRQLLVCILYI